MCVDAEAKLADLKRSTEMNGPIFKQKDDPRITRVGRFIRKCGIDELPQLWDILVGSMSIVGRVRRCRAKWRRIRITSASACMSVPV